MLISLKRFSGSRSRVVGPCGSAIKNMRDMNTPKTFRRPNRITASLLRTLAGGYG